MDILKGKATIPTQVFNGKTYYKYNGERYFSKGGKRLHRVVWEHHKGKIPKGYHVHHKDGDVFNNDISNLNLIAEKLHLRMEGKRRWKNNPDWASDFHAKGIKEAKNWHRSKEGKEWHRQHAKNNDFGNIDYGNRKCDICNAEYKVKHIKQSFCSNKCKSEHRRRTGIDNVTVNCEVCGKPFTKNKYIKKRSCSRPCSDKLRHL